MMAKVRDVNAFSQCCLKNAAAARSVYLSAVYGEGGCLRNRIQNITIKKVEQPQVLTGILDSPGIFPAKMLDAA